MLQKIIKLSKKLIEIPSVKGSPKKLREVLALARSELANFPTQKFSKNGVPSLFITNTGKKNIKYKIILNAHLDIVPAKPNQFIPEIKGDKLYGRGTYDMKAAAACEILVFKELAKKLKYPIALQLVTDEEVGGFNGTMHQISKGIKSDFVLAGEPTNLLINNKSKGPIWLKISLKGKPAHAAFLWQGKNAIQASVDLINQINKLFPVPTNEVWKTTQNLARIDTDNKTLNKVPDSCTIWLDIRYIPKEKGKVISKIRKIIPRNAKLEILLNEPCQFTKSNNKHVKILNKSIREITNKTSRLAVFHGANDIRHYELTKTPGVCFGPVGHGLHSDNEWVNTTSLETYSKILKDFLLKLNQE